MNNDDDKCAVQLHQESLAGKAQSWSEAYPKDLQIFYSIPYAHTRRFELGVQMHLLQHWPGVRDFSRPPQPPLRSAMERLSDAESPLNLHIVRPTGLRPNSRAPVVVYFHGGGFNFGDPLERDLASFVAWAPHDLVVVGVQYRLGAEGFMPGYGTANLGLKDQRLAVKWVKEYIGWFGGDGDDLTLMGISAGAHSASFPSHTTVLVIACPHAADAGYLSCWQRDGIYHCHLRGCLGPLCRAASY
jgi:carboxylesterase type B